MCVNECSIPCDYGGSIAGNLHIECSVERDAAAALYGLVCNNCNWMMMMTMMKKK